MRREERRIEEEGEGNRREERRTEEEGEEKDRRGGRREEEGGEKKREERRIFDLLWTTMAALGIPVVPDV